MSACRRSCRWKWCPAPWGGLCPLAIGCQGRCENDKWDRSVVCVTGICQKKVSNSLKMKTLQTGRLTSSELSSPVVFTVITGHSSCGSHTQEKHQAKADLRSLPLLLIKRRAPVAQQMAPHSPSVPRAR